MRDFTSLSRFLIARFFGILSKGWVYRGVMVMLFITSPAASHGLFGHGPRSTSLAQSDVADAVPGGAAHASPAMAWVPGVRVSVGYSHGFSRLTLDGHDSGVQDIAGTQTSLQVGRALGKEVALGGALALHLPNRSLARIAFEPGAEPDFVRFGPSGHRTTVDAVLAARWRWLSVGIGASVLASARGRVDFRLGQDGDGAFGDGAMDVSLPYDVSPVLGVAVDLGPAGLAFRYRGAHGIDTDLDVQARVDVQGNPLNGETLVDLSGVSGYEPALFDFGARWALGGRFRLLSSLQWARWDAAPSPVADLKMQVDLGLSPNQREGTFVGSAYRDTLSPRLGGEWSPDDQRRWALRIGYAYVPSPLPNPRAVASPADAPSHHMGAGVGYDVGVVWGVNLRVDGAGQLILLKNRILDKGKDTIPFARYEVGGRIWVAAFALEGAWR